MIEKLSYNMDTFHGQGRHCRLDERTWGSVDFDDHRVCYSDGYHGPFSGQSDLRNVEDLLAPLIDINGREGRI